MPIGKVGGGSPFAKIAVVSAGPSAENSPFFGKNATRIGEIEERWRASGRINPAPTKNSRRHRR